MGSRTLPEGSCWTRGGRERQPFYSYPIPEHGTSEWTKSRPLRYEHRTQQIETAVPSHSSELKHTGTNTSSMSASEKHFKAGLNGIEERQRMEGRVGEGISGIGGPSTGPASSQGMKQLNVDQAERAERNWNRRGPSPIQRNILARKLKEAQSCSGAKGRQRSSTFSVSSSEQRKDRCRSLPMSAGYYSNDGSPYRLSEVEQQMLDLDLSFAYAGEENSISGLQ